MKLIQSVSRPAWAAGLKVITSRCEGCHRSMALRHFSAQKAGIRMHDCWYCSSPCFTSALELKLADLLASGPEMVNHVSSMPLGLILVNRGLLTSGQLKEAIEVQKETGGEIGELLVSRGYVSEKQLTTVRSAQWGCPVFSVPKRAIKTGIKIPSTLIQLYSAIPLHYVTSTKCLLVGFVAGIEYGLLYAIEQMTGCKTQPCFVTPGDFQMQMLQRKMILQQGGEVTPQEAKFEGLQSPAEIAEVICKYCVDLEADEAIISRCKDYLWARLSYDSDEVDLLFKVE